MGERTDSVDITVGDPELGIWCEACCLPSKVAIPLHVLTDEGVGSGVMVLCTEHDGGD